ncbi:MAG: T9SS type A sorting domain-containing protein [bacterium]|nr:T9SS type A sorting domain-containing protein [bacterium]
MVSGQAGIVKIYKNNFTGGNRADLDAVFDNSGAGSCYASSTLIKNIDLLNCPNDIYDNQFDFIGSNINHITVTTNANGGRISNNTFTNSNINTIASDNVTGIKVVGSNNRQEMYCNKFNFLGTDIKIASGATVKTPIKGRDAAMNYTASANNDFSSVLTNRYRIDNSGNPTITSYFSSATCTNCDALPIPISINVISTSLNNEPACTLTCEQLFTRINKLEYNNLLIVYPNPSNKSINLSSNELIKSIYLYNQLGQLVYQNNNVNDYSVTIQIENLGSGIYNISATLFDNLVLSKKIMVNQ